jgi:DNA invertase Pin-like site-specific DNA recombinase
MTHQDVIKLLELQRAVKELPSRYGFANLADFIRALEEFHRADIGTSSSAEPAAPVPSSTPEAMEATSQPASNRSKGKRLTAEKRAQIVELVKAGLTAAKIAKEIGCSTATVQNVKKDHKLVKERAKKASHESTTQD